MKDSSTNVIGFIGSYKSDILCYLSRILLQLEKRVAIVDASLEQMLKWSVPNSYECDYINYRGVDIIINSHSKEIYESINYNNYDIVLVDLGNNMELAYGVKDFDYTFIVTDYQVHNVMKLKTLLSLINGDSMDRKAVTLYRDIVDSKINNRYIDNILDIEESFEIAARYTFYLNDQDYKCRLLCQYDDVYRFKGLSKEYKTMLQDIVEELYQVDNKQLLRAIKLAGRGE